MSSAISAAGGVQSGPFRLVLSALNVNSSAAGTGANSANVKINTNIPLGMAMKVNQVTWYVSIKLLAGAIAPAGGIAQIQGQITEALARTAVSLTDALYVDNYYDELISEPSSAVGFNLLNRPKAQWVHVLNEPWYTVAQQFNLIETVNGIVTQGLSVDCNAIIEYDLIPVTPAIQALLSTRLQISGQA